MGSDAWHLAGEAADSGRSRLIPVNVTPFQVGRGPDLMLCLPCPSVSKLHAELRRSGSDLLVRDLQSMNGTYVNGHRVVSEEALSGGDLLQFGNVVFEVVNESRKSATILARSTWRAVRGKSVNSTR